MTDRAIAFATCRGGHAGAKCTQTIEIRRQKNGRLYYNCSGRGGCKHHERFDPDIDNPNDLPISTWARPDAPNVKEAPAETPEPQPKTKEGGSGDGWGFDW
ncbi:MAG: hypothetical protein ACPGO3_13250 [Magnetospiraceae bacterium]